MSEFSIKTQQLKNSAQELQNSAARLQEMTLSLGRLEVSADQYNGQLSNAVNRLNSEVQAAGGRLQKRMSELSSELVRRANAFEQANLVNASFSSGDGYQSLMSPSSALNQFGQMKALNLSSANAMMCMGAGAAAAVPVTVIAANSTLPGTYLNPASASSIPAYDWKSFQTRFPDAVEKILTKKVFTKEGGRLANRLFRTRGNVGKFARLGKIAKALDKLPILGVIIDVTVNHESVPKAVLSNAGQSITALLCPPMLFSSYVGVGEALFAAALDLTGYHAQAAELDRDWDSIDLSGYSDDIWDAAADKYLEKKALEWKMTSDLITKRHIDPTDLTKYKAPAKFDKFAERFKKLNWLLPKPAY